MKIEQFIATFPNTVSDELCSQYVKWFDIISEQGITLSSFQETSASNSSNKRMSGIQRKDEVVRIPTGLPMTCFSSDMRTENFPSHSETIWQSLQKCYEIYSTKCSIEQELISFDFKIHRVKPACGYHTWHHEHSYFTPRVVLAWMIILEAPESGGETEFLFQSMKIEPRVGQLTIWPAGFTHKHRGNPPLEGQKTYMTGWFELRN
jgi:hypothetical protein